MPCLIGYLTRKKNGWCNQQPGWNFCKYLVNEEGVLTHFFATTVSPLSEESGESHKKTKIRRLYSVRTSVFSVTLC